MGGKNGFHASARFIHEAGQLKKLPRSGWLSIGIKNPESVADHSWRTALIGFMLARMEGADEKRVLELCLFHDIHEARVGDLSYVSRRYVRKDAESALGEQLEGVASGKEIGSLAREFAAQETREAAIAKDADLLEMIAQARDYVDSGNGYAREWIPGAKKALKTKSGKALAQALEKTDSNEFWLSL
ncbi:MAG: HD domain-containing protein [Candidatus ainarchaeum sp.]|nr:HD domain-containing protein [Candidatus ainarchaeum sp.]